MQSWGSLIQELKSENLSSQNQRHPSTQRSKLVRTTPNLRVKEKTVQWLLPILTLGSACLKIEKHEQWFLATTDLPTTFKMKVQIYRVWWTCQTTRLSTTACYQVKGKTVNVVSQATHQFDATLASPIRGPNLNHPRFFCPSASLISRSTKFYKTMERQPQMQIISTIRGINWALS